MYEEMKEVLKERAIYLKIYNLARPSPVVANYQIN